MACTPPANIPALECCGGPAPACFGWFGVSASVHLRSYTTPERAHFGRVATRRRDTLEVEIHAYDPYRWELISGRFEPPINYISSSLNYVRTGEDFPGWPGYEVIQFGQPILEGDVMQQLVDLVTRVNIDSWQSSWEYLALPSPTSSGGSRSISYDFRNSQWVLTPIGQIATGYSILQLGTESCLQLRRFDTKGYELMVWPTGNPYLEPYPILSFGRARVFDTGVVMSLDETWEYDRTGLWLPTDPAGAYAIYPLSEPMNCRQIQIQEGLASTGQTFLYLDVSAPAAVGSTYLDPFGLVCGASPP